MDSIKKKGDVKSTTIDEKLSSGCKLSLIDCFDAILHLESQLKDIKK